MDKKNILYVTHYSDLYGANISMIRLIIEMKTNYHIRPIVVIPQCGDIETELKINNIDYLICKFYPWTNINASKYKIFIKTILNFILFKLILSCFKRKRIDLIHTNSSVTQLGGYLSKKLRVPHIWHVREFGKEDYNLSYDRGYKYAGKYFGDNSDIIIAISKSIAEKYSKITNKDKIRVIYNGVSVSNNTFTNNRKIYNTIQFCIVGVITEEKNQIEVINAFGSIIRKNIDHNFMLNIIGGGDENYINRLKLLVDELSLTNYVKFHGYIYDVSILLNKMHVGIVPSVKEAFGRVTIEFMLNNILVIASDSGANSEIITHNKTGLIYRLHDIESLSSQIIKVLSMDLNKTKMIENAFKMSKESFSAEINAKQIYKEYKLLMNK